MDFEPFPKIPRLNRDITITEKLDGTNAAVLIGKPAPITSLDDYATNNGWVRAGDFVYRVQAQSRKRLITPDSDNFGFAQWVFDNAEELVRLLGPGRHFGEWWGLGIQRGYGLDGKRFWLFNPTFDFDRMMAATTAEGELHPLLADGTLGTVPVLYEGPFRQVSIDNAIDRLRYQGSAAAPGFDNPEGVIVYHTASRGLFKVTCKDDEKPKGSNE